MSKTGSTNNPDDISNMIDIDELQNTLKSSENNLQSGGVVSKATIEPESPTDLDEEQLKASGGLKRRKEQPKIQLYRGNMNGLKLTSLIIPKYLLNELPEFVKSKSAKTALEEQITNEPELLYPSEATQEEIFRYAKQKMMWGNYQFQPVKTSKLRKKSLRLFGIRKVMQKISFNRRKKYQNVRIFLHRESRFSGNILKNDSYPLEDINFRKLQKRWRKMEISFINTIEELDDHDKCPIQSRQTIILRHSKRRLNVVKDIRIDGI
jgi:hypothetical protein